MRTWWEQDGAAWTLRLRLDPEDTLTGPGQSGSPVRLVTNSCTITLPEPVPEPHPDLLALAALLVVRPWTRHRLRLDRPVSAALAGALATHLKLAVEPVDDAIVARTAGSRLGLSYSTGVDSIAAAELIDRSSPYLHLQRVKHPRMPNRATHLRADQIARLVTRAAARGRDVHIATSDLEFLCLPWPQFPTWVAVGITGVMLADALELGGLAFGTVLETAYLRGGRRFRAGVGDWPPVLAAVALPMCQPVAGLTEVGTLRLAAESELADLAQSCLLGAAGKPCLACVKCVRKELLAAAVAGRRVPATIRHRLRSGDPAAKELEQPPPLHMHNCVEYIVARLADLDGTLLADLARRMEVTVESTAWNERYYPRALGDYLPERWREPVADRLRGRVDPMRDADVHTVETWDGARRLLPRE